MPRYVKKRKLSLEETQLGEERDAVHTFQTDLAEQSALTSRLSELYLSKQLTDVVFVVGGREFHAHRVVLAAASGFLSAMLTSNMSEATQARIELSAFSFDASLFHYLLDYIYGLPIAVASSNVVALLGLASSYSMTGLRDHLAAQLACRVTLDNCCSIFATADAFNCEDLKRCALDKVFSNFASVSKSIGFCELSVDSIELVLGSDDILDCDESLVFQAAVRWLEHPSQEENRQAEGLRVLSLVRFPLMDSVLLSDVIKGHKVMAGGDRACLLLEAFEHHALKAAGRDGVSGRRVRPRRQSCVFLKSTLLDGHSDAVSALLNMGDWLVSGSWDLNMKVWSTDTWACLRTLSDHSGAIRSLCVCDGKLVSCSDDGVIKVWTPGAWSLVRSIENAHEGAVNAVLQCRGRLASAGDDGVIKLWNTSTWDCEVTVHNSSLRQDEGELGAEDGAQPIGVLSLEMSGDRLVSGGDDCAVRVWNTNDWSCECLLGTHEGEVWSLLFLADGALITSSVNGSIRVWREQPSESQSRAGVWECESQAHAEGSIYALCALDGRVVSAGGSSKIIIWGAELDFRMEKSLHDTDGSGSAEGNDGVWSLAVCKGRLVSGLMDGTIRVWT